MRRDCNAPGSGSYWIVAVERGVWMGLVSVGEHEVQVDANGATLELSFEPPVVGIGRVSVSLLSTLGHDRLPRRISEVCLWGKEERGIWRWSGLIPGTYRVVLDGKTICELAVTQDVRIVVPQEMDRPK